MDQTDRLRPTHIITSTAPIRICDNGGWTDTWFAGHGQVFNIAVCPMVEVQIAVYSRRQREHAVVLVVENYNDRYPWDVGCGAWGKHPLLEAAVDLVGVPDDLAVEITLFSEAPAGAGTGTSAAVVVALIGALDRLTPGQMSPHQVAFAAHRVETDMLGRQCGLQDQLAAAYGGINYIEMFAYPHATVSQIRPAELVLRELERRLALVYLGQSHQSSAVHERVIASLEAAGPSAGKLEALRTTAGLSRDAVYAGDFAALGRAMVENTAAQRELHPDLISADAQRVIDIAQGYDVRGWKVNGAGGEGGSLTLLCGQSSTEKRALLRRIENDDPRYRLIPIQLSRRGLQTWVHTLTC